MIDIEKHAKHEKACSIIGKTLIFGDFFFPWQDGKSIKVSRSEDYSGGFTADVFILDDLLYTNFFATAKYLYDYLILRV